jgi:hypothetical protein
MPTEWHGIDGEPSPYTPGEIKRALKILGVVADEKLEDRIHWAGWWYQAQRQDDRKLLAASLRARQWATIGSALEQAWNGFFNATDLAANPDAYNDWLDAARAIAPTIRPPSLETLNLALPVIADEQEPIRHETIPVYDFATAHSAAAAHLKWLAETVRELERRAQNQIGPSGARADEKKHEFVQSLAKIYRHSTGNLPQPFFDPVKGEWSGAFLDFAEACLIPLQRDHDSRNAIAKLLRRAVFGASS